jgi:hypothetical protein
VYCRSRNNIAIFLVPSSILKPVCAIMELDEIRAKLIEAQDMLEALQGGQLHIGNSFEGRTEAKMYGLRRQIAMYESMLDKSSAA